MTAPPFGKACQALRSSIFLVARSQLCRTRPSTRTSAGGRSSWKKLPGLRQDRVSQGLGAPDAAVETAIATEAWPICTTMDAVAENADWAQLDADFAAGKTALGAGDWSGAIAALKLAALRDPRNSDIQNYIGYATAVCASWNRRSPIIGRRWRSIRVTAARTSTSARPIWRRAIWQRPKNSSPGWTISASSPAPNTPTCRPRSRPTGKPPRAKAARRPTDLKPRCARSVDSVGTTGELDQAQVRQERYVSDCGVR